MTNMLVSHNRGDVILDEIIVCAQNEELEKHLNYHGLFISAVNLQHDDSQADISYSIL